MPINFAKNAFILGNTVNRLTETISFSRMNSTTYVSVFEIRYIGIKELTYLLLKFYKMNEKFINHMIDNHLTDILNQVFKRDLILLKEALHAPSYINPYLSDFIASGLVGLLTCYRHDQSSSIEDIAVQIDSIFDKNNIDKI